MTLSPERRAEIERMIALLGRTEPTVYQGEAEFILNFRTRDAFIELLAEIDRLNEKVEQLLEDQAADIRGHY